MITLLILISIVLQLLAYFSNKNELARLRAENAVLKLELEHAQGVRSPRTQDGS